MKKALWNALVAGAIAAGLIVSPSALGAKKKTPTPAADASDSKADKAERVNLNTASEKEIAAVKGVSDKLAKELVKNRPYRTWDDVSKVKGVGSGKKLDSLKKVLKLSEGVAAKDDAADKKDMKSKSSSKGEEKTAAGAGAAGGSAAASGKTPVASEPSSPSKKSSSSSSSSSEKLAPGTKININTASAEELEKLPEIGPVKALAIVDYRKANGRFAAPEDIEKVKGIKEGTFAKIKDYIVVR